MDYLVADNLESFQGGVALLRGVSLRLSASERIGLIGRNGAGKTHLLRVLAKAHMPEAGRVIYSPGLDLRYLPQTAPTLTGSVWEVAETALGKVRGLENALRQEERRLAEGRGSLERYADLTEAFEAAGGYGAQAELEKTLHAFGFESSRFMQAAETLSGGERARLRLATLLNASSDVLLLDEPTNHLDLPTRRTLAARLTVYRGTLLVASHDRALLDAVCTHTARLEDGTLTLFKGNYSRYQARQAHARVTQRKQVTQANKERSRLEASGRTLAAWGTPKAQRQRKQLARRLERLGADPVPESTASFASSPNLTLHARKVSAPLLRAEHLAKTFGALTVHAPSLELRSGDKVALVGPNGAGKSTLLGLIADTVASDDARSVWHWHPQAKLALFDQRTRGVVNDATPIAQLTRFISRPRAELLLALVKLPPATWNELPTTLSGGERARLGVALMIAGEANVLLLDEPTNDLDIAMITTLETTLVDTEAAVVFATHDAALVEAVATRVWSLESGELVEYRGGLAGYLQGTRRQEAELSPELEDAEGETVLPEVNQVAELERLEQKRLDLETDLLDPLGFSEREYERLARRYEEVLDALSVCYDARLPAPLPRFEARYSGVTVTTEGLYAGVALFQAGSVQFQLRAHRGVGHLRVVEGEAACSLAWARRAALGGALRLGFEHLNISVIQLQTADDLSSLGFQAVGQGWWLLSLSEYEAQLGYA